jgi:hypothetical protein
MMSGETETPWSDCKVAFGCYSDDFIWKHLTPKTGTSSKRLPVNWELCETDGSGARCVAIFQVEGIPTAEEGATVSKLIEKIDSKARLHFQKQERKFYGDNAVC